MSFQITTAFVQQYRANVELLSQQRGSLLRPYVREEPVTGTSEYFDQIGATAAVKRQARHADTPLVSTPHSRRKVTLVDYDWADLVDNLDKVKMLIDPTSPYAQSAAMAFGRSMDDEIIAALGGTAYTGVDGTTAVTFPSGNKITEGGTGLLTVAKLLSAKLILDKADVDPSLPRYFAISANGVGDLLNTTEVKSSDYNTVKALAQGQIDSFLGFKFIMSNRLPKTGNIRTMFCWAEGGVLLGVGTESQARITERADKNYAMQVYNAMSIGATRMEEAKVVWVEGYEA
jgi:ABC-type Fe3+ transport system substrate-binding protein